MVKSVPSSSEEELKRAKLVLRELLADCGQRMEKAEKTLKVLENQLEEFRGAYAAGLGHVNPFRQEELRVRLRRIERETADFRVELRKLRVDYNRMYKEYSRLCR